MQEEYEFCEEALVSNNGTEGPFHRLTILARKVGGIPVGFYFIVNSAWRVIEGGGAETQQSAEALALKVIIGLGLIVLGLL